MTFTVAIVTVVMELRCSVVTELHASYCNVLRETNRKRPKYMYVSRKPHLYENVINSITGSLLPLPYRDINTTHPIDCSPLEVFASTTEHTLRPSLSCFVNKMISSEEVAEKLQCRTIYRTEMEPRLNLSLHSYNRSSCRALHSSVVL